VRNGISDSDFFQALDNTILFLRSLLTAKKRCTDVNALKKRNRQAPDAKNIHSGSSRCTPATDAAERKIKFQSIKNPNPLKAERQSNLEGMQTTICRVQRTDQREPETEQRVTT